MADNRRRDALVIGIDSYPASPLRGCVRDAEEIAAALSLEQYGFDCTVIGNKQATRTGILEALGSLAYSEEAGSFLLVYFAGHGQVLGNQGHLVTVDSTQFDPGISLAHLGQIMESASRHYNHVLSILDCCHAGLALTWANSRPLTNADILKEVPIVNESRIVLAACRPEETAKETAEHGYFTKSLLDGMLGDAVDFRGTVTPFGLFEFATSTIPSGVQNPVIKGDAAGSVVLGSGFHPRVGSPIPHGDLAQILGKAMGLVDKYTHLQQNELFAEPDHKASRGYDTSARELRSTLQWFTDTETSNKDITRNDHWRSMRARLSDFQSHLASLSPGFQTPWGRVGVHIGHGGYGHVWEVVSDSKSHAFKVFHANELDNEVKVQRFRNGYNNMRKLDHPRIVQVRELTEAPYGFLMDYVAAGNLREAYLDRRDAAMCIRVLIDVAETVQHAHSRGVRHRDIKPENILLATNVDGYPMPYLTDFDLAYHETNRTVTTNLGVGGVLNYAAPEQLYKPNTAAARAETVDVFSLGQLLFFVVTAKDPTPEAAKRNSESLRRELNDWVEGRAAEIILSLYQRSVDREPANRPQSVAEFSADLIRAEALVQSSSGDSAVAEGQFLARLGHLYSGIGSYSIDSSGLNMSSLSGQVDIFVRDLGLSATSNHHTDIEAILSVTGTMPVPTLSGGEKARRSVNARLDKMLAKYRDRGVSRHAGSKGVYQTILEFRKVPLDVAGVSLVAEVISHTVAGIEQW